MALITIYADASFCPHTGAAGGSYVIKHKSHVVRNRFEIHDADDSWEAEVMAYGQALLELRRDPILAKLMTGKPKVAAVLDCEGVGTFMGHSRDKSIKGKAFRPCTLSVREMHNAFVTYCNMRTTFIHVKSHTDDKTIAAFWNSQVDKEAYNVMVNMRKTLTKQQS